MSVCMCLCSFVHVVDTVHTVLEIYFKYNEPR